MCYRIENLVKKFNDHTALQIPHLVIEPGEILGIVGRPGSGKTTFLRLLLGLIPATSGCIYFNDKDIRENRSWESVTSYFLHEDLLIDLLRVGEYIHMSGSFYNLSLTEIDETLKKMRPIFGGDISKFLKIPINDLPREKRYRIGLIAALMAKPQVLILDDPLSDLDLNSEIELKNILKEMNADDKTTVIITARNLSQISGLCHRVMLLENGYLL